MKRLLLSFTARAVLITVFTSGALWAFVYSLSWDNLLAHRGPLIRLVSSEGALTVFYPIVPAAMWGAYQIDESGTFGLVVWDWGCTAVYLLVSIVLLRKEGTGIVLAGILSAANSLILLWQLVLLWFDGGHVDSFVMAVVQRGLLVVALLGYATLGYRLLRLAIEKQIIAVTWFGPIATIRFLQGKIEK